MITVRIFLNNVLLIGTTDQTSLIGATDTTSLIRATAHELD